jgi:DNA-binding MarR family transcriptional regulator
VRQAEPANVPGAIHPDAISRIDAGLVALTRRIADARGNSRLNQRAGVDLERSGWILLARIDELEPVRLSDVAAAVGIEISTASRQVARLVERGFVERATDPKDGRAVVHRLTPDGRDALGRIRRARREWLEEVLAGFDGAECDALAGLFERLVDEVIDT